MMTSPPRDPNGQPQPWVSPQDPCLLSGLTSLFVFSISVLADRLESLIWLILLVNLIKKNDITG